MLKYSRLLVVSLVLLKSFTGFSQEISRKINGEVKSPGNDVSNVLIINLNSKKSTITDSLGLFTIEAKLRDSIKLTAVQYLTKEIIITDTIFNKNSVAVILMENVIKLIEVTVMPYNLTGKIDIDIDRLGIEPVVTSSTLGLPNADIEVMTQSERLLLEADRGKYVRLATIEDRGKLMEALGYLNPMIIINTHKIMNRVSGRTKSFEERVARDENIALEKEINTKFSKKIISENFDIPETSVDGFLTFCVSQTNFSKLTEAGNTMEIWEYLKAKSIEFKESDFSNE